MATEPQDIPYGIRTAARRLYRAWCDAGIPRLGVTLELGVHDAHMGRSGLASITIPPDLSCIVVLARAPRCRYYHCRDADTAARFLREKVFAV